MKYAKTSAFWRESFPLSNDMSLLSMQYSIRMLPRFSQYRMQNNRKMAGMYGLY
jgi:hypothetical protein